MGGDGRGVVEARLYIDRAYDLHAAKNIELSAMPRWYPIDM